MQLAVFLALGLEKVLQLQLLYRSCSSRTVLDQFKISNYLCVPDLAKINELLSSIIQFVAAAARLQLQQRYTFGSIQNVKQPL